MLDRRLLGRTLMAATALAAASLAAPASAQEIDRIVAFGDSYADQGNLVDILEGLGAVPPLVQTLYPTGRFSGGTVYIDTLSQLLHAPVDNFAVAGALTGNSNTFGAGLPGFPTEVGAFLAGGGVSVFPAVTPTFGEGDLLAISIGGNDARIYQQTGGTVAGAAAAAQVSAAQATAGLNALVNAGAPTISFLAGNTAALPEIAGDTSAQAVRNAFSTTFYGGMQDVLAGYAADGVIVHYLDLSVIGEQIIADPAAYGLTSTGACNPAPSCIGSASYTNQFLFYVDGIHLTSAGFAIVARYVQAQLQAPLTLQAPSDLGLDTARQFGRTLNSRMDLAAPRDGDSADGIKLFVVGDTFSRDVDDSSSTDAFDIDGVGGTVGMTYGMGTSVVGLAANYSRPKAHFGAGVAETTTHSYQLGAFAGTTLAWGFAQAHVGYGKDQHRLARQGVVEDVTASPDGTHWTAGAKAGWLMSMGALRVGPVAAVEYDKAKVDSYSEGGDAALNLDVSSVSAKALTGSLGIEARGDFDNSGIALRPYVAAAVEKDFIGDSRSVHFAQQSAPGIVNTWELEDRSNGIHGRLSGGASAAILERVTLDAIASTTVGRDDGNEVSAHLGLRVGL